jgi:hypothetical protein
VAFRVVPSQARERWVAVPTSAGLILIVSCQLRVLALLPVTVATTS